MTTKVPDNTVRVSGRDFAVEPEVMNFVDSLIKRDQVAKETIKSLAQVTVDLSASMTPFSGLTMIGLFAIAKQGADFIGEEIKPSEQAFERTIHMVNTIRQPLYNEIEELNKQNAELKEQVKRLKESNEALIVQAKESAEKGGLNDLAVMEGSKLPWNLERRRALAKTILSKKGTYEHYYELFARTLFHDDGAPRDPYPTEYKSLREALQLHPYFKEILKEGVDP